jgi:hypothetical protein
MGINLDFTGQLVDIEFQNIVPKREWILPTVELTLKRTSTRVVDQSEQDYVITNLNLQLSLKKDEQSIMTIGYAKSASLQQTWRTKPPENESDLIFEMTFDNYTLSQIEKIRKGNNLPLFIRLSFQSFPVHSPADIAQHCNITIEKEIPKSDWVDKTLPGLNYKNVALIELPKLKYKSLDKPIQKLNDAWKSYSSGDMDEVLTNCRKALEEVGKYVQKRGYVKKEQQFDRTGKQILRPYPNWKQFFESDTKSDVIGTITKKMFGFVAPGAHSGGILDMNYAYFALLQTFSLIYCTISRLKVIENKSDGD